MKIIKCPIDNKTLSIHNLKREFRSSKDDNLIFYFNNAINNMFYSSAFITWL